MCPSPTGHLHIGTARTTLFNWLFAKHHKGTFILRLEDTDRERSTLESEIEITTGLKWLGLEWDEGPTYEEVPNDNADQVLPGTKIFEVNGKFWRIGHKGEYGPYRQTERNEIYRQYLDKLLADGSAYYCYCTKEEIEAERSAMEAQGFSYHYPGRCRNLAEPPVGKAKQVIRLKIPEGPVEFQDLIRGKVVVKSEELDDFALARSNGDPLYNFVVTVDDISMKITHVIRAEDHISNTPKQILIYRALGAKLPEFAHVPLILDTNRAKLSKRTGQTNMWDYISKGYLPDAMFNFLATLGWHSKEDKEIMAREEVVGEFDLDRVQKSGAVFNLEKLDWLNREYIKSLSDEKLADLILPYLEKAGVSVGDKNFLNKIIKVSRDRLKTLDEIALQAGFFFEITDYPSELLLWKKESKGNAKNILDQVVSILSGVNDWSMQGLQTALQPILDSSGRGEVLWPVRVALSGLKGSPDPYSILEILGPEESSKRLRSAVQKLA